MKLPYRFTIASAALLLAPQALAHDNGMATGLLAGIAHPFTGLDHLIALVLGGLLLGRHSRGRLLSLGILLLALSLGSIGGIVLGPQGWVEVFILLSLPVILILHLRHDTTTPGYAIATLATFLAAHGWAHGVEASGATAAFITGFLLGSVALLGLGLWLGRLLTSNAHSIHHA